MIQGAQSWVEQRKGLKALWVCSKFIAGLLNLVLDSYRVKDANPPAFFVFIFVCFIRYLSSNMQFSLHQFVNFCVVCYRGYCSYLSSTIKWKHSIALKSKKVCLTNVIYVLFLGFGGFISNEAKQMYEWWFLVLASVFKLTVFSVKCKFSQSQSSKESP